MPIPLIESIAHDCINSKSIGIAEINVWNDTKKRTCTPKWRILPTSNQMEMNATGVFISIKLKCRVNENEVREHETNIRCEWGEGDER